MGAFPSYVTVSNHTYHLISILDQDSEMCQVITLARGMGVVGFLQRASSHTPCTILRVPR